MERALGLMEIIFAILSVMSAFISTGWKQSVVYVCGLFVAFLFYEILRGEMVDAYILNRIVADIGMVLIGYSIAVVSMQRLLHWRAGDHRYRKELGITGFVCIVFHGALTLSLPRFPLEKFFLPENIIAFLFAVISFLLLTMMSALSLNFIKRLFSERLWWALIRLGILAYAFCLAHAAIKSAPSWFLVKEDVSLFPPLSLIVVVCATLMLLTKLFDEVRKLLTVRW